MKGALVGLCMVMEALGEICFGWALPKKPRRCPLCSGTGKSQSDDLIWNHRTGEIEPYEHDCYICHGKGLIEE